MILIIIPILIIIVSIVLMIDSFLRYLSTIDSSLPFVNDSCFHHHVDNFVLQ